MFADAKGVNVRIEGPGVNLQPAAAEGIGLALHELATNSIKYGALSAPTGCVSVSWRIIAGADGSDQVSLLWREAGGPKVEKPTSRGFGAQVIETLVARTVDGQAHVIYAAEGLQWTLDFPLRPGDSVA